MIPGAPFTARPGISFDFLLSPFGIASSVANRPESPRRVDSPALARCDLLRCCSTRLARRNVFIAHVCRPDHDAIDGPGGENTSIPHPAFVAEGRRDGVEPVRDTIPNDVHRLASVRFVFQL